MIGDGAREENRGHATGETSTSTVLAQWGRRRRDAAVVQMPPARISSYMCRYLASSMVAGLVVTTAMNPLDVISTRLYTQGTGVKERYTGPLDCAMKTMRAEGFRGVSEPSPRSTSAHCSVPCCD